MSAASGWLGLKGQLAILTTSAFALAMIGTPGEAQPAKEEAKKAVAQLPVGGLDTKDWLKASIKPLEAGEIDRLINTELARLNVKPASRTTDEEFIRRVTLDLTGRLPAPPDIKEFASDKSANKRARLIDRLLNSPDYAKHWSQYWRTVIMSKVEGDFRLNAFIPHFDIWMREQLRENKSWAHITTEILTANGKMMNAESDKNGQAFFLVSRKGADAVTEITAETSRIFLGIQIQCAQCHDHPSDVWKRHHFHELAAYFARYRERPIREEMRFIGSEIVSVPIEHRMPDKDSPKTGTLMNPKFLDGKQPAGAKPLPPKSGPIGKFGPKGFPGKFSPFGEKGMSDEARRKGLAQQITSKDNPWFAAAFVNRIWGEFMGQSFYAPIDDLGPQKDAMMPTVIARVAASFRGNDYDIKQLMRDILNSDAYQRQIRPGESGEEHLLFAAHNPVRMNADSLWNSVNAALGPTTPGGFPGFPKKMAPPFLGKGGFGLEGQFKQAFGYDPSTKAEEIEGSIAQTLILMNNAQINQKIKATNQSVLGRILANFSQDDEAIRAVYVKVMARRPTDRELSRCREHVRTVGNRAEAFEDILWALINSTEFQMKR